MLVGREALLSRLVGAAFASSFHGPRRLHQPCSAGMMSSLPIFSRGGAPGQTFSWVLRSTLYAGLSSLGAGTSRIQRWSARHAPLLTRAQPANSSSGGPYSHHATRVDPDVLLGNGPPIHALWESILMSAAAGSLHLDSGAFHFSEDESLVPAPPAPAEECAGGTGSRSRPRKHSPEDMRALLEAFRERGIILPETAEAEVAALGLDGGADFPALAVERPGPAPAPESGLWDEALAAGHAMGLVAEERPRMAGAGGEAAAGPVSGAGRASPDAAGDGECPAGGPRSDVLRLSTAVANLPHPDKAHKGGEDAWFISEDGSAFGVADGVGGWAEHGVDPAEYARELMRWCHEAVRTEAPCGTAPKRVLRKAYLKTRAMGSSTACVAMLCGDTLHVANIGDSGVSVVRDDQIVFTTPPQQHDFNFPFQLGSENISDPPEEAQEFHVQLRPGDVLIAASDGLWDNLWANEIVELVGEARRRGKAPRALASVMAKQAQRRGMDQTAWSPFMHGALQRGYAYMGGKLDDITVLVSYVSAKEGEGGNNGSPPMSKM